MPTRTKPAPLDRLTARQMNAALAAMGMTRAQLGRAVGHSERGIQKAWDIRDGDRPLSPRLSQKVREHFEAMGLTFLTVDGRRGLVLPPDQM